MICCEITLNTLSQEQDIGLYITHIDQILYAMWHHLATMN